MLLCMIHVVFLLWTAILMLHWMFPASFIPFSTLFTSHFCFLPCNCNRVQSSVATHRNSPIVAVDMYTKYIWYRADQTLFNLSRILSLHCSSQRLSASVHQCFLDLGPNCPLRHLPTFVSHPCRCTSVYFRKKTEIIRTILRISETNNICYVENQSK